MIWEAMPPPIGVPATDFVIRDGIRAPGAAVGWIATVEAFDEHGPYYANALDVRGRHHRSGPKTDCIAAKAWAENIVQRGSP